MEVFIGLGIILLMIAVLAIYDYFTKRVRHHH